MNEAYHTRLRITCPPEVAELIMAEIAEAGFDGFLETEEGFEAYVEEDHFNNDLIEAIISDYQSRVKVEASLDKIAKENWNEQWEKSFDPIIVEDKCLIRADFHPSDAKFPYELIITPKMSFGTGHHETTYLMIKNQLQMDHRGKRVMDAGCGTAILSIMACKLGAFQVEAFDIDEWSVSNSNENIVNNGCPNITHRQGKLSDLPMEGKFDIILANINKNVLLEELPQYERFLATDGVMLLSGFFSSDIPDLLTIAKQYGLGERSRDQRGDWSALLLSRQSGV